MCSHTLLVAMPAGLPVLSGSEDYAGQNLDPRLSNCRLQHCTIGRYILSNRQTATVELQKLVVTWPLQPLHTESHRLSRQDLTAPARCQDEHLSSIPMVLQLGLTNFTGSSAQLNQIIVSMPTPLVSQQHERGACMEILHAACRSKRSGMCSRSERASGPQAELSAPSKQFSVF